jgi:hypothetical protein
LIRWWISLVFALRRTESVEKAEAILLRAQTIHPKVAMIAFNLACYASVAGRVIMAPILVSGLIDKNEFDAVADSHFQRCSRDVAGLNRLGGCMRFLAPSPFTRNRSCLRGWLWPNLFLLSNLSSTSGTPTSRYSVIPMKSISAAPIGAIPDKPNRIPKLWNC